MITNPVAVADVEYVIEEFVKAGKIFTALHVTTELRERRSPAGILRHMTDISPEVREAYNRGDMSGYSAVLDSTGNFHVYYPVGADPTKANINITKFPKPIKPNEAIPQGISGKRVSAGPSTGYPTTVVVNNAPTSGYPTQVTTAPPTPPVPTPSTQAPSNLSTGKYLRKLTDGTATVRSWRKGGYVETPREMLRQAGLSRGTLVKVEKDPTTGVVSIEASNNGNAQVQSSRHCLRLHKNLLAKFLQVTGSDGIQFTYNNGTITLDVA